MKGSVLLIGNFFASTVGNSGVCEDLAIRLAASSWQVATTSGCLGRLTRLLDMTTTVWLQRHRYDVAQVDVYSGLAFLWAEVVCMVLRRANKPFILTLHGGNLPVFAQRWPYRVQSLLISAAAVTTPSHYLLEQMRPYRKDLQLLPNALDLSSYKFMLRNCGAPNMVWLRAFHKTYNPLLALKVLAILDTDWPNIRLAMAGPDKADGTLQRLERLAAELGLTDQLTLPGKIPKSEVPNLMNNGHIFLNTSNVDNTPVSVLEAMACGMCIVSTNVGGIPYLLKHGFDALLVPPDDPIAMAAAVNRLLTEPDLAEQLSDNARRKVELFDWSVILPQWDRLLTSVAMRPMT